MNANPKASDFVPSERVRRKEAFVAAQKRHRSHFEYECSEYVQSCAKVPLKGHQYGKKVLVSATIRLEKVHLEPVLVGHVLPKSASAWKEQGIGEDSPLTLVYFSGRGILACPKTHLVVDSH